MTDKELLDAVLKKFFMPTWFDKDYFEAVLERDISDEQWEEFVRAENGALHDYFEDTVIEFVENMADEYFGGE